MHVSTPSNTVHAYTVEKKQKKAWIHKVGATATATATLVETGIQQNCA